ncbi:cardio acceleratory peptide 2b isoform X2 [Anabrus simplex]|uniref:cardio acceleratory peptide 2b isoform X2 n=1 Tax=Anabrus simplex TaxID=316456 RepID=UPI0035A3231C
MSETVKIKREAGLFPFPRVGRSEVNSKSSNWRTDNMEMKRQGLIPFPRVGRGGALLSRPRQSLPAALLLLEASDISKRANGGESNGMWFGPRLGRRNKRSIDFNDLPWTLVSLTDSPNALRHEEFQPGFGNESIDMDDDSSFLDEDREQEIGGRRTGARHSREVPQHSSLSSSTEQ